eukprot:scaffold427_cov263-Pinguiococcus_pyrenoidosus.AAC.2
MQSHKRRLRREMRRFGAEGKADKRHRETRFERHVTFTYARDLCALPGMWTRRFRFGEKRGLTGGQRATERLLGSDFQESASWYLCNVKANLEKLRSLYSQLEEALSDPACAKEALSRGLAASTLEDYHARLSTAEEAALAVEAELAEAKVEPSGAAQELGLEAKTPERAKGSISASQTPKGKGFMVRTSRISWSFAAD